MDESFRRLTRLLSRRCRATLFPNVGKGTASGGALPENYRHGIIRL
ncbi:MAG: hypothetical protein LBU11_01370 [Zoogloeaceae bacterium]|nr:hypothetical protein [Zoogloeaceae bacterium]